MTLCIQVWHVGYESHFLHKLDPNKNGPKRCVNKQQLL